MSVARLSEVAQGRDNNFNLIRILAALAVLVGHSFPIALGKGAGDPVAGLVGISLGGIAVDVFFVTSGFLVTGSLLSRDRLLDFFWARALRIFPALTVMVMLSVFGLGLYFTTLPTTAYLSDPKSLNYLVKNIILFRDVVWDLPGVFESNPFKSAVNGSLWTLPKEVKLYTLLGVIWFLVGVIAKNRTSTFGSTVIGFTILGAAVVGYNVFLPGPNVVNWHLFFMFFIGSAFYTLRGRVVLSRGMFWLVVMVLAFSAIHRQAFLFVYVLTLGYVVLYVAYVPTGYVRLFNRAGDYSYGVYIYAFPVQQSVAALVPGISIWGMIAIASAVTLVLAVLSWHWIERPALDLRGWGVNLIRRLQAEIFSFFRAVRARFPRRS